jgi:uncharacterized membrane protein
VRRVVEIREDAVTQAVIFDQEGLALLSRWGHFLAGITWIGLLYYFNFVQTPSFAEMEAAHRSGAVDKLVPRALWWFRYGAALTVLFGLMILGFQEQFDGDYFKTTPGMSIATGATMGIIMMLNVWLVIWPNQQILIASTRRVAAGGEADPAATAAARKAAMASRTNTFLSIPMLLFMGLTSHLAALYPDSTPGGGERVTYYLIAIAIIAAIEANGLGAFGTSPGSTRIVLDDHKNTIIAGFVVAAIFILVWEVMFG